MANQPEKKFRIGLVSATVWKNSNGDKSFFTVDFQRSYKDGDEYKNTTSFGADDLLNVAKLSERAEAFIAEQ